MSQEKINRDEEPQQEGMQEPAEPELELAKEMPKAEQESDGPAPKESEKEKKSKKRKNELDPLRQELCELSDRYLRTVAEYENYRKRTDREKLQSVSNGCCNAVEKLLPALDALERAVDAESTDAEYKKGVLMTVEVFRNALQLLGVDEIKADGLPFDPQVHYAVSRGTVDGVESGTVVGVMQKGYQLGDRVIRHAMVVVAE